jgi:hypothetical protein
MTYTTLSDSSDETIISIITPVDSQITSTTQYIYMYILYTFVVYLIPSIALIVLLYDTYDTSYDNIKLLTVIIFGILLCTTIMFSVRIYSIYMDTIDMLYKNKK